MSYSQKEWIVRSRKAKHDYVQTIQDSGSCLDCGSPNDLVFVHVRGKKDGHGILTLCSKAVPWKRLKRAIANADLLCRMCREKRHGHRNA